MVVGARLQYTPAGSVARRGTVSIVTLEDGPLKILSGLIVFTILGVSPVLAQVLAPAGESGAREPGWILSLTEADRLLLENNREVKAARRIREAAGADVISAGARPNPILTVGIGSINPAAGLGSGTLRDRTIDSAVRLDQPIERGGKRDLRIQVASSLRDASGVDVVDVVRQQRVQMRAAYFDLLLAQERVSLMESLLDLAEKTLQAAQARQRAGDIAQADIARLEVDALRSHNDLSQAQSERHRARIALASSIGRESEAARLQAGDPWPELMPVETGAIDTLVEQRADVRAARVRVEASRSARELARRLRTRDISVGASYDHYPASATNPSGSGNSFGFSVSVPIFAWYGYEGELARAESDLDAAQEALARTRALALTDMERVRADVQSAAERLRRFDQRLLVEARRSAGYAEFAYRNGAIGLMDLLDARRVLRATEADALQARAEHARALVNWRASVEAAGTTD